MSRQGTLKKRLAGTRLESIIQPGLRALRRHRSVIHRDSSRFATDSLGFDELTRDSPTFDYLVGVPGAALALEIHPAQTHEIRRIVEKKRTTEAMLPADSIDHWCWAPTSGVHLHNPKARAQLAQAGIRWPRGALDLRELVTSAA